MHLPPPQPVAMFDPLNERAAALADRVLTTRLHPYQAHALRFLLRRCSPEGMGRIVADRCVQWDDPDPDLRVLENVPPTRCVLGLADSRRVVF